jgi:hypothetical protein
VAKLVMPYRRSRFEARDDDVSERYRAEAASCQDQIGEAAIAYVEKATVATARQGE